VTRRSLFAPLIALALLPQGAPAQAIDGKAAFEKLKGLAGTWSDPDSRAAGLWSAFLCSVAPALISHRLRSDVLSVATKEDECSQTAKSC